MTTGRINQVPTIIISIGVPHQYIIELLLLVVVVCYNSNRREKVRER
jgi:hypothetical protein